MTDMGVPVTVLSGALGVGKTTTLNHVLAGDHGYEAAVLINDVGEVNVDADLTQRRTSGEQDVLELSNGCICCGIQGEFERAITDLATNEKFDYLLVEPSGISEPEPVARQFVASHAGIFYELNSVTTVVDTRQFYDAFERGDVSNREKSDGGDRPLSDLVVEGLEFCDTIVLNKTDLVSDRELESVTATIRTIQPEAELLETAFGRVDPAEILGTGRFDAATVPGSASWKRALEHHRRQGDDSDHDHSHDADDDHEDPGHDHDSHDHPHPPEVYGIDSFVYRRRRPMHPERLADALCALPKTVVRAKGYLHVAGRSDHALTLSTVRQRTRIEVAGRWIASLPEDRRKRYRQSRQPDWDERFGDRKTELVVIGREMDEDGIERRLDRCLLTGVEPESEFDRLENPFPERGGAEVRL